MDLGQNLTNYAKEFALFPSFLILSRIFLISSAFEAFSFAFLAIHL